MTFKEALETGLVILVKAWRNANSTKDQVSLQFFQKVEVPANDNVSLLVSLAQGQQDAGKNIVSVVFPAKREVAETWIGEEIPEGDGISFRERDTAIFAKDMFGVDINIGVDENHDENEYDAEGNVVRVIEAKINPTTKEEVLVDGKPVYRHTFLEIGEASRNFLSNNSKKPATAEAPANDGEAKVEEPVAMDSGAN